MSTEGKGIMGDQQHWDERYRTGDLPWDTGQPSTELVRVVREGGVAACPTLELGCGTGTNAVWLASQGFDVTALDISPRAIERAKQRAALAGVRVHFLVADVSGAPHIGGPFGFFFDRGCYHCVREIEGGLDAYLRTVESALRPGAQGLILTGNANEPRTGPPIVSEAELRRELGRVFEIVRLREFRFDPIPGEGVQPLGWSCFVRRGEDEHGDRR